ncbi:DUF6438 domain-containing protein [Aquimarina sp. AU474]|uniref:DUF6438 domain-containing protein n=1 Tax=Aquimarina sp. AU474 TaxID=2108529 RepID=UPI00135C0ECC|nr:DUF6438 domain-containing protein [Aquimarina sp. AU474]
MKYIMILLIMINFSCQSTKDASKVSTNENEAMIYYAKGPCRGKCQVFDMWIYEDGSISYTGIRNVTVKGNIKGKLQEQELEDLKTMLDKPEEDITFKKVWDWPTTTLRYKNKEYKYYSSKIDGTRKKLDTKLKNIVRKITTDTEHRKNKHG